jgi:hypothetical protein
MSRGDLLAGMRHEEPPAHGEEGVANAWLDAALDHLGKLVSARVSELEKQAVPAPLFDLANLPLETIGKRLGLGEISLMEAVAIMLAVAPDLQPHLLDQAISRALESAGNHPSIGGIRGRESRIFLPTGETFLFLAGARSVDERLRAMRLFEEHHRLTRRRIVLLDSPPQNEPQSSARMFAGPDTLDRLVEGPVRRPKCGPEFPAERIDTDLEWDDLVLDTHTLGQIRELEAWVRHGRALLDDWGLRRRLRPGYRALFFGPPGTGKTLTASLLGHYTGRDVYRIDLSLVVSKFIGETEKNLGKIFAQAEDRDWILFFDEADALFGKRTQVRDAHDRYANQEVAYLLQRVESFEGLVILASNFRNNIDDAFLRRFQSVIHFPKPSPEDRLRIWRKMLPGNVRLEEQVNLPVLCQRHELTGANVANIVQYACLQAITRGEELLRLADIQIAIEREFRKEGRVA